MSECYFPSRWRIPVAALGVTMLLLAAVAQVLTSSPQWGALGPAAGGVSLLWRSRRSGVTLSDGGVRLRSSSLLGGSGFWRWQEIRSVEVVDEEHVRIAAAGAAQSGELRDRSARSGDAPRGHGREDPSADAVGIAEDSPSPAPTCLDHRACDGRRNSAVVLTIPSRGRGHVRQPVGAPFRVQPRPRTTRHAMPLADRDHRAPGCLARAAPGR